MRQEKRDSRVLERQRIQPSWMLTKSFVHFAKRCYKTSVVNSLPQEWHGTTLFQLAGSADADNQDPMKVQRGTPVTRLIVGCQGRWYMKTKNMPRRVVKEIYGK